MHHSRHQACYNFIIASKGFFDDGNLNANHCDNVVSWFPIVPRGGALNFGCHIVYTVPIQISAARNHNNCVNNMVACTTVEPHSIVTLQNCRRHVTVIA